MNYTPIPQDIVTDASNARIEAPIVATRETEKSHLLPLIIGIFLIIAIVIGGVLLANQKSNTVPETIQISPTISSDFNYATPVIKDDMYVSPTIRNNEDAQESEDPEKDISPDTESLKKVTITPYPELPEAGMPAPLLVASFLGAFIILVGFVF